MAVRDRESEPVPSYTELLSCVYDYIAASAGDQWHGSTLSSSQAASWKGFSLTDTFLVMFLAVALTAIRYLATEWYFKPLAHYRNLTPTNCKKMPESAWRFLYYSSAWSFQIFVCILSGRYEFFQSPSTLWKGWSLNEPPALDIYCIYMIECGFYVHSLYATLFLDTWRKDSFGMIIHHVVTLLLLSGSHSVSMHKFGMIALLTHDICDVFMEFAKLNTYFKMQGGKNIYMHNVLANASLFCFVITWFLCRLYYFPLKLLYTSTCVATSLQADVPYYGLMNTSLWILQALNIYWSFHIVKLLVFLATGKLTEVEDTREYDDDVDDFRKQTAERPIENRNNENESTSGFPVADGNNHVMTSPGRRKFLR